MVSIRPAYAKDLLNIQHCNLLCLPENYQQKYFIYHLMSWPLCSFVAVDTINKQEKVVGYVLGKLEEDNFSDPPHGHITSLAVQRSYRRRGIAQRLMYQTSQSMVSIYNAQFVSLHVRESNRAAFNLYSTALGFTVIDKEMSYYADGEDGLFMRLDLVEFAKENYIKPAEPFDFFLKYKGAAGDRNIRSGNTNMPVIKETS